MRIVHVCVAGTQPLLSPFGGAIQRRILELSKAQVAMGHDVTAYSAGRANSETTIDGVTVRFIRCLSPMPWRHAEYLARLSVRLRTGLRPDVINFHGQPEGVVIAKALSRPGVLFYDNYIFGGRRGYLRPLYRRMLGSFDLLLPCSKYCADQSLSYWELDGINVSVQYNGVNLSQFSPNPEAGASERERLEIRGLVVLYVGRVNAQKGTDLLVDSFSELRERTSGVTLVVAGPVSQFGAPLDSRAESYWRRKIEGVGGVYLGVVPEERLSTLYSMADVFVMPTRTFEMFGMAAVEAQACGCPVIASDHGGLRETVPEECGGRFPVGNAVALAEHLERILGDTRLRHRCSKAAMENARRYSWDRVAIDLETLYARAGFHG